jgi:hypothetical protein
MAIEGLLFHRFLARVEKGVAPGRDPGGRNPQFARQEVESFPA